MDRSILFALVWRIGVHIHCIRNPCLFLTYSTRSLSLACWCKTRTPVTVFLGSGILDHTLLALDCLIATKHKTQKPNNLRTVRSHNCSTRITCTKQTHPFPTPLFSSLHQRTPLTDPLELSPRFDTTNKPPFGFATPQPLLCFGFSGFPCYNCLLHYPDSTYILICIASHCIVGFLPTSFFFSFELGAVGFCCISERFALRMEWKDGWMDGESCWWVC